MAQGLCRKPRGLLTFGLWTPMSIGHRVFLGVRSGRPENQDGKMIRGVHRVEIPILSFKMFDMECQVWKNTSKSFSKRFKILRSLIDWLTNLGLLFQPRHAVFCMLAHCSQFTKISNLDSFKSQNPKKRTALTIHTRQCWYGRRISAIKKRPNKVL